jgi:ATP-dependent DNA ligase
MTRISSILEEGGRVAAAVHLGVNLPARMRHEFSVRTKSDKVPTGDDWLREVKYDGYRMMLILEQDRVRLISSGGHDWARHFPPIVEAPSV